ncbi:MAG: UDP-glucose dehydrogenase family protein [Candidatus Limnocylindrales bacterium]
MTVIGAGYVGLVTAVGMASLGHTVELVETRVDRLEALRAGRSPLHEQGLQDALSDRLREGRLTVQDRPVADAEVVLVCVGTPIGVDGRSDLSQLRSALQAISGRRGRPVPIVIRSTIPPGSTREAVAWATADTAHVLTNPEFLRQGTALADFGAPSRIVIGCFDDVDPAALETVRGLYDRVTAPVLVVDVAAAELIKNGANAFLALKLSFTNEMAALAEEYGTDIDTVLAGLSLDPRIGSSYMRPSYGFGGSCLPKELQALAVAGQARGLPMHVTIAASNANDAQQRRFADRIDGFVDGVAGRQIAVLGLAFKAGTDDVRDSPALALARRLVERGGIVRAYDPQAGANARREFPALEVVDDAEVALDGADAVVIATEWPAFAELDWAGMRRTLSRLQVIDGRRLLDPVHMRSLGYRYLALGTGTTDV